ncbi:MAG: hypothetical protein R3F20_19715 [Planctomycetota bacterium]
MGDWSDRMKGDPGAWLLEKACPPIRYRYLTEVVGRPADDVDVKSAEQEVYAYKPAQTIVGARSDDGTWFGSLLGFEAMNLPRKKGPGTVPQYRALIEYGWGKDHPIIWSTSDLLQGLLWEDPGLDLRELNGYLVGDPAVEAWLRKRLSRVALTLLVRSGFHEDPGVKRKKAEYYAELEAFYQGDVHAKIYVGETTRTVETDDGEIEQRCALFDPQAPLPSQDLMTFLAFDPDARTKHSGLLEAIADYLFAHAAPEFELTEIGGKTFEKERDLEIRSLDRKDYEDRKLVGRLLQDLELLARCGVLTRSPKAVALVEWLVAQQDEEGVVRADDWIEKVVNRLDYGYFPLEDNWRGKHKKFTDLTFRLMLILRLLDDRCVGA